jgi:hypothetical protein
MAKITGLPAMVRWSRRCLSRTLGLSTIASTSTAAMVIEQKRNARHGLGPSRPPETITS